MFDDSRGKSDIREDASHINAHGPVDAGVLPAPSVRRDRDSEQTADSKGLFTLSRARLSGVRAHVLV